MYNINKNKNIKAAKEEKAIKMILRSDFRFFVFEVINLNILICRQRKVNYNFKADFIINQSKKNDCVKMF